ncbi:MAG: threonine/serine dehydratase [Rhodobacteraceae bacterium]|nr:threonine/serine dehydratase [Paracoccaceae bacterium]
MTKNHISLENLKIKSENARKRIVEKISNSPLIKSNIYGTDLFFKAENFQFSGSFKIRGAFSKLTQLEKEGVLKNAKLITASSGNHGLACSYAARELGGDLTVVLPETVAIVKLEKIRSYGITVILEGQESGEAETHAQKLAKEEGYLYVSPYNDLDIIAGQGTIGLELIEALGQNGIDNVFVSMGGGGLISGISAVLKAVNPNIKVWGVSAENSCTLGDSLRLGKIVDTKHLPTLADGVSGGIDSDTVTFEICKSTVDELLWCDEKEITSSFLKFAFDEHQIIEGSAALALAGYEKVSEQLKGQTSVVIACGANVDQSLVQKLLSQN